MIRIVLLAVSVLLFLVAQEMAQLLARNTSMSAKKMNGRTAKTSRTSPFATTAFACNRTISQEHYKSQSGEDKHLLQWFNGLCSGKYLEMGALDGITFSNSHAFHKGLNWKGVLIELMPGSYNKLVKNRPDELATINAGVCATRQMLHYVGHGPGAVSGIYEFAAPSFRRQWWDDMKLDDTRVKSIECEPLEDLLLTHAPGVTYFDFFSLDVEGAEYSVLKSINFDRVGFGVIFVEADEHSQRKNLAIRTLLESKGYQFLQEYERSYWFVNNDFHNIYNDQVYEK